MSETTTTDFWQDAGGERTMLSKQRLSKLKHRGQPSWRFESILEVCSANQATMRGIMCSNPPAMKTLNKVAG
jgi:hypothetical protein